MGTLDQSAIAKVITERRAVKKGYTKQRVEESTVRELLDHAIWAPTHGMRQPWRFVFVDEDTLPTFAKKVAATYDENMQQNREDYLNEPNAILVVIMEEPEAKKQWEENYGATASMIQNFWLLAWEQDLGVVWKTNPHIFDPKVVQEIDRSLFWVNPDCGLKTRKEDEVREALTVLVNSVDKLRKSTNPATV